MENNSIDLSKYIVEKRLGKIVLTPLDINKYDIETQIDGKIILSLKQIKLDIVDIPIETLQQLSIEYITPFMRNILSAQYENKLQYLKDLMNKTCDLIDNEKKKKCQFRSDAIQLQNLTTHQQCRDSIVHNKPECEQQACYDCKTHEINNLINRVILDTQLNYTRLCYKLEHVNDSYSYKHE